MRPSSEATNPAPEAGFTLIESLVALTVVAVVLAAIGALVAANVRGTRSVENRLSIVDTARMLLAALPDRDQLQPGDTRGELGGNSWRIDVMPFTAGFVDPSVPTPWIPQAVVIRVEAPTGEILRVDTVRLRSAQGN